MMICQQYYEAAEFENGTFQHNNDSNLSKLANSCQGNLTATEDYLDDFESNLRKSHIFRSLGIGFLGSALVMQFLALRRH